jgi:hypothetical protein
LNKKFVNRFKMMLPEMNWKKNYFHPHSNF